MPLTLKAEEQELLREEVGAFVRLLPDEQSRERYRPVLHGIEAGALPDETLGPVGDLLEVGLQTGHVRKLHRASGEQALLRLFGQTPAGQAQAAQTAAVNQALAQLEGQTLESTRVLTRVPGTFLLQLSTDACEITLRFGPDGAAVESVALGI